ncbi:MAG: [NiFe]-hydrogenase assembly chaperone HybE, partial [Burkholderiaceae bacterium]|nr:[NiFe]-hydrogenase assembly chaperone HybE [Burkholderiaceae bacterium]
DADAAAAIAEGVLITPWFMSLVRLPAITQTHQGRVGRSQARDFGCECFDFIGSCDPTLGYHETCALFSPMNDFDSQAWACDTAREVLAKLRPQSPASPAPEPMPARRAFFLARGRSPQ